MEYQIFELSFDRDIAERRIKEYVEKGYTLINVFFVPADSKPISIGKRYDWGGRTVGKYEGLFTK
jgi:hypothetical protein